MGDSRFGLRINRHARGVEARQMRALLRRLGENLGFQIRQSEENDIVWVDGEQPLYWFRLTTTALLGPHLLPRNPRFPGGAAWCCPEVARRWLRSSSAAIRACSALSSSTTGSSSSSAICAEWRTEVQHRGVIEVYLGLDPIVEQEQVQIPLPWK